VAEQNLIASAPVCFVFRWPFVPTQDALTRAAGARVDLMPPAGSRPSREVLRDPLVTLFSVSESPSPALSRGVFDCLGECAMDVLGIKDIIALGGVIAGLPTVPKPRPGVFGSGGRTSPLSLWLGEKLPQKLPHQIRVPTNIFTRAGRRAGTVVLGRLIARLIPGLGWVMLGIDMARIGVCVSRCAGSNGGDLWLGS
jgi:hypothetical protein